MSENESSIDRDRMEIERMIRQWCQAKPEEIGKNIMDLFKLFNTDPACGQFFAAYRAGRWPSFEAMLIGLVIYLHKCYADMTQKAMTLQEMAPLRIPKQP